MRRVLMGIGVAAVIAICASPALAGSRRHGSGGGGGSEAQVVGLDFPAENEDSDSERPANAVPEPSAGLVFAAGALVLASRLRRRSQ